MGISQFYFPLFEESLAAQNIPLEIKYLAVVESALNPRAVSKAVQQVCGNLCTKRENNTV